MGSTTTVSGTWNGAGQLTAYSDTSASVSSISYDGQGMRASMTVTPSGGTASSESFVWGTLDTSSQLLMDSSNAYIYAQGNVPEEQVNLSTGRVLYLVSDSGNSVRGVVSSSGSLLATTWYDPWGNAQTAGGLTAYTPFSYGGLYEDATGLLYSIDQYYDPTSGQYLPGALAMGQIGFEDNDVTGAEAMPSAPVNGSATPSSGETEVNIINAKVDGDVCGLFAQVPSLQRDHKTGQREIFMRSGLECWVIGHEDLAWMHVWYHLSKYVAGGGGEKGRWEQDSGSRYCNLNPIPGVRQWCDARLRCHKMEYGAIEYRTENRASARFEGRSDYTERIPRKRGQWIPSPIATLECDTTQYDF